MRTSIKIIYDIYILFFFMDWFLNIKNEYLIHNQFNQEQIIIKDKNPKINI